MSRMFTLEELEKRWNIPYEILFKMLYGYETGVLKGTDIFARISLPYFGKEIKGQLNFKNTKESKLTMEEATNLSVAISNMTIEEKQNTDIVKRIIQGDKLQLKRLTKKNLKWYIGMEMDVSGTITRRKNEFVNKEHVLSICVLNVIEDVTNDLVAEHTWIRVPEKYVKKYYRYLYNDTKISFSAVVKEYLHNNVTKYCLANMTNLKILSITEKQKRYIEQHLNHLDEKLYIKGLYKRTF